MLRILALIGILVIVTGCQTGSTDTAAALSSAAGTEGVAVAGADAEDAQSVDADGSIVVENGEAETNQAVDDQQDADANSASAQPANADPVIAGVRSIAAIRNKNGEPAAVLAVFSCYKKAREKSVTLTGARICAAQDFVVSREVISSRPATATGTNDRPLLVSKRHAERIGALLKLKGMNQSQFNTFGAYLHAVAEPEYQKARQS